MDQVTDIAAKLGMGGRLYKDAREVGEDVEPAPAPAPAVEHNAPQLPKPWQVSAVEPAVEPPPKPEKQRDWRETNSTALEVAGLGLLSAGFWMLQPWLGLVVLGVCLVVLGVATGLPDEKKTQKTTSPIQGAPQRRRLNFLRTRT